MFACYINFVPARTCIVSFTDADEMKHSVEVAAGSLYEAAALGLKAFRSSSLPDATKPGVATRLVVAVKAPGTEHEVTVRRLQEWLNCGSRSPKEAALKASLRAVLEG